MLAEAYGQAGQVDAGVALLTDALGYVGATRERLYESELHRLKGELLLMQSGVGSNAKDVDSQRAAEACFWQAIQVARDQSSKSLELRASRSLARLWREQGKPMQAFNLLDEVFCWFSEGFDTPDLKDVKALLRKLQGID